MPLCRKNRGRNSRRETSSERKPWKADGRVPANKIVARGETERVEWAGVGQSMKRFSVENDEREGEGKAV